MSYRLLTTLKPAHFSDSKTCNVENTQSSISRRSQNALASNNPFSYTFIITRADTIRSPACYLPLVTLLQDKMHNPKLPPNLTNEQIVSLRPSHDRPRVGNETLGHQAEQEAVSVDGGVAEVLTLFLRGSECRFRCLMCDLWKYTYPGKTPAGSIPAQVQQGLDDAGGNCCDGRDQEHAARWIKLYNASNFFSPANVPDGDLPAIATKLVGFDRVVVENHPTILRPQIEQFRDSLDETKLELAMGLETVHPPTLELLNKSMQVEDFARACEWLHERQIDARSFVLLRPPGMTEEEGVHWSCESIDFAASCGVRHISLIPLRGGNGSLEYLESKGFFCAPELSSLEEVMKRCLRPHRSFVLTVDLWDWEQLRGGCAACRDLRKERLEKANLLQRLDPLSETDCQCVT